MLVTFQRAAWRGACLILCLAAGLSATPVAAQDASGSVTPRTLPPKVQEDVEAITQQLLNVRDTDVELSCPKAVENARYGLETMLEVGQRNRDGGYIDADKFDKTAQAIRVQLVTLTAEDCAAAQGGRLAFYRCMSSDYNHVMACAELDR